MISLLFSLLYASKKNIINLVKGMIKLEKQNFIDKICNSLEKEIEPAYNLLKESFSKEEPLCKCCSDLQEFFKDNREHEIVEEDGSRKNYPVYDFEIYKDFKDDRLTNALQNFIEIDESDGWFEFEYILLCPKCHYMISKYYYYYSDDDENDFSDILFRPIKNKERYIREATLKMILLKINSAIEALHKEKTYVYALLEHEEIDLQHENTGDDEFYSRLYFDLQEVKNIMSRQGSISLSGVVVVRITADEKDLTLSGVNYSSGISGFLDNSYFSISKKHVQTIELYDLEKNTWVSFNEKEDVQSLVERNDSFIEKNGTGDYVPIDFCSKIVSSLYPKVDSFFNTINQ